MGGYYTGEVETGPELEENVFSTTLFYDLNFV
jgi:hypothetical protein